MATTFSAPFTRKPPAAAMLPLILIFVCGVAIGALAMSFVIHNNLHKAAATADRGNRETVLKWKNDLNLTESQQHELEMTLDDLHKYYDNVLSDGKDRILAILNEQQRQKFEHMLQERHKP